MAKNILTRTHFGPTPKKIDLRQKLIHPRQKIFDLRQKLFDPHQKTLTFA